MAATRPAVFLDRDGVLNRKMPEGDYVKRPEELEILPGAGRAIERLRAAGFVVLVVTNQRGVARGLMSPEDLFAVTETLWAGLAADGQAPDGQYACLHDKADRCGCRKPAPGMLLAAADERGLDLGRSWMVGDRESDIAAGVAAGCRTVLVGGDPGSGLRAEESAADGHARDLEEAAALILAERSASA